MAISKDKFESAYERVKYQLELEGFSLSDEDKEVIKKVATGEMSRSELIKSLKKGE